MRSNGLIFYFFVLLVINIFLNKNSFGADLGVPANIGEVPHVVLIFFDQTPHCTGTILHTSWVLSAANCLYSENNDLVPVHSISVIAGATDQKSVHDGPSRQKRFASEIIVHPNFWYGRLSKNDLALIKLTEAFKFNTSVFKLELSPEGWPIYEKRQSCLATTFGTSGNEGYMLMVSDIFVKHGSGACPCTKRFQWKRMICARQQKSLHLCELDSGTPLMCDGRGVAIMHMTMNLTMCTDIQYLSKGCIKGNIVAMYLYLCPYFSWLSEYVPGIPPQPQSCQASYYRVSVFLLLPIYAAMYSSVCCYQ